MNDWLFVDLGIWLFVQLRVRETNPGAEQITKSPN